MKTHALTSPDHPFVVTSSRTNETKVWTLRSLAHGREVRYTPGDEGMYVYDLDTGQRIDEDCVFVDTVLGDKEVDAAVTLLTVSLNA